MSARGLSSQTSGSYGGVKSYRYTATESVILPHAACHAPRKRAGWIKAVVIFIVIFGIIPIMIHILS